MTKEELLKKIDFEKNWLYDCGIFGSDVDIAFHAIKNSVIETLEQEPCEDAVSRQAVIDCFKKWQPYMATRLHEFENELFELPSFNPQKIGHWIIVDATHSKCDRCWAVFEITSPNGEVNYCPNCGARMEG